MNVLLIGGAGFLGLNFAKVLINGGHKVSLFSHGLQSLGAFPMIDEISGLFDGNCSEVEKILEIIDQQHIQCVINLASRLLPASTQEAFDNELIDIMSPSFRLLSELATKNIKYVYVSSGGAIYGKPNHPLTAETDPRNPINLYGLSKALFEEYITFVSRTAGLNYLILRPSNPYGPFQSTHKKQGLIAVVVDKIIKGEEIEIWGNGLVIRDYIWAEDLANALNALLGVDLWNHIYNIGSGAGHSINEVILTIENVLGISANCVFQEGRAIDAPRVVLDIAKIKSVIDFSPIPLHDGIRKYTESLRVNKV